MGKAVSTEGLPNTENTSVGNNETVPLPNRPGKAAKKARDEALSEYLAALGGIPLFTAADEIENARLLEEAELEAWRNLLLLPDVVNHLLADTEATKRTFEEPKALARHAKRFDKGTALNTSRVKKDIEALVMALRAFDDDRTLVVATLERLDVEVPFAKTKAQRAKRRELVRAAKTARRRALRIRNKFVQANLRLVVSGARRFHHYRMPLIDLIQEGNLGLIKSVHRFDHRRGFRFSTYAHWWIRQAVERAIMNKGAQVRLPVHIFDQRREVAKASRSLSQMLGRDPSVEELAEALGQTPQRVQEIMRAAPKEPISLSEPVGDEEDRTMAETIADDKNPLPDDAVIGSDQATHVRGVLKYLTPMEVDIIERRFGLIADKDETLEQIGRSYNLSRERVRQIQVQGLKKMLRFCQRRKVAI